ncbi:spore coat protein [Exiguobacterium sp. AM39-5BH]|uniref:spore coat protein n=1 Tax=Exiguobacterium sp. AM39-5BH TaxID=2292355 RepID=UPI000FE27D68|nr:spore coat protein [Exiguobacterium sp. AM39-5BH]RHB49252.1 spore coat protein [Exiguobacterium sp. AM39-5BH]
MAENKLAIHEILEIHEILTLKQAGLVKGYVSEPLIKDEKLQKIAKKQLTHSEQVIKELKELLPNRQ